MKLFAVRKGDREIMLTKRKVIVDGRPALQMIQLVDSEEDSVKPASNTTKRLRRNFFKRSKPMFSKFDDEITCSPSNAYQPPPAHLFPSVAQVARDDKEKTIAIAGTHSTDSSSTAGLHDYQPPTFRIAALEPSMSVEEIQRACSPSVEGDRRSSSSFVQFAFDAEFQRIEELAMFSEPAAEEATSNVQKKTKTSSKKKQAETSLDFPTVSFENLAMKDTALPTKSAISPSQSVVSVTNATITGFDDEVAMTYTEETGTTDPFVVMDDGVDLFADPFKVDAVVSQGSGELLGTKWVEPNISFPEPKATSSHDSSSLIDSIRRECQKPKKVGTRDPSPRYGSNPNSLSGQQWEEEFGADEFPEGRAVTQVFKREASDFIEHMGMATAFPEVSSKAKKAFDDACSEFMLDKHSKERFSEIGFPNLSHDAAAQPVNEIVIQEQTNCIKGLPASAIAASMIFRQTIAVQSEEKRPCHDMDERGDDDSNDGAYFPDGTPMQVRADRHDALSSISSLTEGASSFDQHHPKGNRGLDVWGRQAQNVINHWNFAAKKVREEMTSPSPSKKVNNVV